MTAVAVVWALLMVACVVDVVVNKLNPIPKMKNNGEERVFARTICKTREMYSVEKR